MASDLIFNGTPYPGRSGANKFGTFYSNIQPPPPDIGVEILRNNGMELGFLSGIATTWQNSVAGGAVATFYQETSILCNGTNSQGIILTTPTTTITNIRFRQALSTYATYTAGNQYILMFNVKNSNGNGTLPIWMFSKDGASPTSATCYISNTEWNHYEYRVNIQTTQGANRFVEFMLGSNQGTFYFDDVYLHIGSMNNTFSMENTWGSRLVEMTGRVRGCSGYGTISKVNGLWGTGIVTLPSGMFLYRPIIGCYKVRPDLVNLTVYGYGNPLDSYTTKGKYITDDWSQEYMDTYINRHYNLDDPYGRIITSEILSTGFKVTIWASPFSGEINPIMGNSITYYWHAFGV